MWRDDAGGVGLGLHAEESLEADRSPRVECRGGKEEALAVVPAVLLPLSLGSHAHTKLDHPALSTSSHFPSSSLIVDGNSSTPSIRLYRLPLLMSPSPLIQITSDQCVTGNSPLTAPKPS